MRLSSSTENERAPVDTKLTAASPDTTASTVIPYNAPTATTFEQALTQANVPPLASTTSTPQSISALPSQSSAAASTPTMSTPVASTGTDTGAGALNPLSAGGYGYYMMASPLAASGATAAAAGTQQGAEPMVLVPVPMMLMPLSALQAYGGANGTGTLPLMRYAVPWTGSGGGGGSPATAVAAGAASVPVQGQADTTPSVAAPASTQAQRGAAAALQMPFSGPVDITQGFGPTSLAAEPPFNGYAHFHTGLDFGLPSGTAIDASAAGTVVAAGWDNTGYGNRVIIDHGNGVKTLYGHLEQVDVTPGMQVVAGQQIGLSGSTGNSTGPHLHFGVALNGQWVDPAPYLQPGSATTPTTQQTAPVATPQATGAVATAQSTGQVGESNDTLSDRANVQATAAGAVVPLATTDGSADGSNPPPYVPVFAGSTASPVATPVARASHPQQATVAGPRQMEHAANRTATPPVAVTQASSTTTSGAATSTGSSERPIFTSATVVQSQSAAPVQASAATATTPVTAAANATGLTAILQQAAAATGVPESLLAAVVQAESGGNPNAESPSGAKGLMQLMDSTAAAYGATDSFDPRQNAMAGARFLGDLLHQYQGNTSLALAAYNAGPGAVARYGGIPPYPETRAYVAKVLQLQQQYAAKGA